MKYVFFLLCFVVLCFASCKHHCHDNGDCVHSTCECFDGWTGDSCDTPFLPLEDGDEFSGTVDGKWNYFYTETTEDTVSLLYDLSDTLLGDCDLFVRFGDFPTHSHHDYSDSGIGSHSSVLIEEPQEGVYIAGVYNFFECSYVFSLTVEYMGNCPNDCSDHGVCNVDNICECEDLYGGEDCSQEFVALVPGESHEGSVEHYGWNMYYYDATLDEESENLPGFYIVVNQTATEDVDSPDSDLFVKFESVPTLWEYDERNAGIFSDYFIQIDVPTPGRYYIGVYGYTDCNYEIQVQLIEESTDCASQCSAHGYCESAQCTCYTNYSGNDCETMDVDLQEGQSVQGYAPSNAWNFYSARANSANNMVITVTQDTEVGGDCDLYVRADELPDRFNFDYRDIGYGDQFSITIENPYDTHYFIGIYGYRSCQYFIEESISANSCPNDCSDNGNCVEGRCSCNSGFTGDDCASSLNVILSGNVISNSVGQNQWRYFKYTAPAVHTSVLVAMFEPSTAGYLELYVLQGAAPSLAFYDEVENSITSLHSIYFLHDGTQNENEFYIGVYGTSHVPIGEPISFTVFVYSPPI